MKSRLAPAACALFLLLLPLTAGAQYIMDGSTTVETDVNGGITVRTQGVYQGGSMRYVQALVVASDYTLTLEP